MVRPLWAGAAYFGLVFGLGFALGVVRVLITAPRLGEIRAVLLEAPVIPTASWLVSRWCVAAFRVAPGAAERMTMGFAAFSLTMLAELGLAVLLFGRTIAEHLATYTHAAGLIGLVAQLLFALIPYVQGARR